MLSTALLWNSCFCDSRRLLGLQDNASKNVFKNPLGSNIATVFFLLLKKETIEEFPKEFLHILQICWELLRNPALSVA